MNTACKYLLSAALLLSSSLQTTSSLAQPTENELKAAFIVNFVKFVQWPERAFRSPSDPIILGVIGHDRLTPFLDRFAPTQTVRNRRIEVRHFDSIEKISACHIVFISRDQKALVPKILQRLEGKPILTVSELKHFSDQGGMITLLTRVNKIRFAINPAAVQRAQLKMSSRLLRLAKITRSDGHRAVKQPLNVMF